MMKRVVIAVCRDYNNYNEAKEYIDFCISEIRKKNEIVILSGGARVLTLLVSVMLQKTDLKQKNTLPIGKNTAERQGL